MTASNARMRRFHFFGRIEPLERALHLKLAFNNGPWRLEFASYHFEAKRDGVDLDEVDFDKLKAEVLGIAIIWSLLLSLAAGEPYDIVLESWQEFDAESGQLMQPGQMIRQERRSIQRLKIEKTFMDEELPHLARFISNDTLRQALIDFRNAMHHKDDALVFLWRAVETIDSRLGKETAESRKHSRTDQKLGLKSGTVNRLFNVANNPNYGQRHANDSRASVPPKVLEDYTDEVRKIISLYARSLGPPSNISS